jgi:dienelactone hydrolase
MGELSVEYRDGHTELVGLRAWPDELSEPRPGVLIVHGGAGLDEHARGRARRVAALDYVVLAADMYGTGVAGDRQRVMSRIGQLIADRRLLCARLQAAIDVLAADPRVDGRLAAIGYCFGGRVVLEAARAGMRLAAVVSVHGGLSTDTPARRGELAAKVLVCHGALDPHIPRQRLDEFIDEMNAAGADWQLNVYGRARHGFTHDHGPPSPGVAYDAATDARSTLAIEEFLAEAFNATPIPTRAPVPNGARTRQASPMT